MKRVLNSAYKIKRIAPLNYKEGDFDGCISEFEYHTYDHYIKDYDFCLITHDGVLWYNALKLVNDSLIAPKMRVKYNTKRIISELYKYKKRIISPSNKYILAFDGWSGNHYHFLCEFLTRIFPFQKELYQYITTSR